MLDVALLCPHHSANNKGEHDLVLHRNHTVSH